MNTSDSPYHNVLHYTTCWLQQTMVWLYEQIIHIPAPFVPHIVCEEVKNLEQFNLEHLHCRDRVSRFVRLRESNAWRFGFRSINSHLEKVAEKNGVSLMHSHFGNVAWMNSRTATRLKVPHVASFYGYDVSYLPNQYPKWEKLYRNLFINVGIVLALGKNMASELRGMGCPSRKINIHHLGVDLAHLPFCPRQWNNHQPLRVLIAGSFKEKKGIPYALEALAKLQGYVGLEITIIGDATASEKDQFEKRKIIDTVQKLKLSSIVKFLGYQPYRVLLTEAYNNHIYLAPSITASDGDTEGIPMTIVEMAASGMPIVSSFHSDIPEIIQHGETGWLVPERSVDELASCLRYLIDNPEKWGPVLKAGRQHIESEFDAQKQGLKLAEIYRQLL